MTEFTATPGTLTEKDYENIEKIEKLLNAEFEKYAGETRSKMKRFSRFLRWTVKGMAKIALDITYLRVAVRSHHSAIENLNQRLNKIEALTADDGK